MSPTATTTAATPRPPPGVAAPHLPAEPPPRTRARPAPQRQPARRPQRRPPRSLPAGLTRRDAKARTMGCPCRAEPALGLDPGAMPNGRCCMHRGNCRGPSTPKDSARMTAANTKHGSFSAHGRAEQHDVLAFINCNRPVCAARRLWRYLAPDMAARLAEGPDELSTPIHPSNLPYLTSKDAMPCNVKTPALCSKHT